jgi:RIO kinase 1
VHGDLSVYNLLVWKERLYVIDFPQAVDPVMNTEGLGLLERDVANLCKWFAGRGVAADAAEVYAELLDLMRLT